MPTSRTDKDFDRSVAVVGGGIAGITAAIKLAKKGYKVTLFEKADHLGGNLSSASKANTAPDKEVYPHIFGDWYEEFWNLLRTDFGIQRETYFASRPKVRMAIIPAKNHEPKGFKDVQFFTVNTPTSLRNLTNNCLNGVMSKRDSFLFGYTYLDLVSVPATAKRTSKLLSDLDVTGYLFSRPFMNNEIAEFHDDILKIIWSMPSDSTSAKAYQKLIRHTLTFPRETPFAWFVTEPLGRAILPEITSRLRREGKVRLESHVLNLALSRDDKSVELKIADLAKGSTTTETFRFAVIATPAKAAGALALGEDGDGGPTSLVHRLPRLARLREAQTARIPVVYLYFTSRFLKAHKDDLEFLPDDLTGFKQRKLTPGETISDDDKLLPDVSYDISIHNIATVWDHRDLDAEKDEPVLVVAASRATAIVAEGPEEDKYDTGVRQGWAMLRRLADYFPFIEPGSCWGDDNPDVSIDWNRTRVITNEAHQLFLNDTGSNEWRPKVKLEDAHGKVVCDNVFFAGDYCMTDVDMATVEAAVQSGALAAQALMWENEDRDPDRTIRLTPHTVYASHALLLAKLFWTPAAFAAAMSAAYDEVRDDPPEAVRFPLIAASMATSYWADWLKSAMQLVGHAIPGSDEQNEGPVGFSGRHDNKIGVLGMAANVARAVVVDGPRVAPQLHNEATDLAYGAWRATVGRILFPGIRETWTEKPRRWNPAKPRPEGRPQTWPDLVGEALDDTHDTAERVSRLGFAAASGAVHFLRKQNLLAAIAEGADAYRRKDR